MLVCSFEKITMPFVEFQAQGKQNNKQIQTRTLNLFIFCLPNQPNFSDIFDLCLHWMSVVRGFKDYFYLLKCSNAKTCKNQKAGNFNVKFYSYILEQKKLNFIKK